MISLTSPTMPRITYIVNCSDPFGDPCWEITALDITYYRNQGFVIVELEVSWKASEHEVVRNVPYKFQQDLKEIVIKTRGEYLDYFKKVTDKQKYWDEKERLEKQVKEMEPKEIESDRDGSDTTTKDQPGK